MNAEDRVPNTDEGLRATAAESPPEEKAPDEQEPDEERSAPLLDPIVARRIEEEDRKRPIPGGEPECPQCGKKMVRRVERYPAPHGGASPFRIRLQCPDTSCGAWTVYDW